MKKSILIAVGIAAVVIFASFPAGSSAGEYVGDCEVGAVCSATIAGGAASFSNTSGETTSCTSVTGNMNQTSGSSTGTIQLTFHGCKETVTGFKFSCNSPGQPAGTITTNTMTTHKVNLESAASKTPGLLITGWNTTYECTGFSKMTYTGNVLGHITNPNCGTFQGSSTVRFEAPSHGQQKYKQVTTTGTVFDLISNNHAGGSYLTAALVAELTTTVTGGNKIKTTC
jgi:hypothetical protein